MDKKWNLLNDLYKYQPEDGTDFDGIAEFILAREKALLEPLRKHKEFMKHMTTHHYTALGHAEEAIDQVLTKADHE